jgi:hypothetical protein
MFYTDKLISYTIDQPLTGTLLNDELTSPQKSRNLFSQTNIASTNQTQANLTNSNKVTNFDKINQQSASNDNLNGDEDHIQKANSSGINQKINLRRSTSKQLGMEDKNFNGDVNQTNVSSLTANAEKLQLSSQSLTAQEIKMPTNQVSNEQLVMHLKFDRNSGTQATDSSSSGKNRGELRNGATFKNLGTPFNNVVSFDGKNDYINVNDSNNINLGTYTKRTISLRFKVDDKNISNRKQILFEEGGGGRGLNLYVHNGRLYVGGWNNPTSESNWKGTYLSTDAIASNKWHTVTLVLNANESKSLQSGAFRAYLDGKNFGTGKGSQIWSHGDNIGIGNLNQSTQFHDGDASGTGKNGLAGSVDDVRVYNRALSDKEIAALANLAPVANADKASTQKNTAVTLLASDLLKNDKDSNGDRLKLTSVNNANNGTVALDKNGNVIFDPTDNFIGNGSFKYAIADGRGGTSTATVTVSIMDNSTPEPTPTPTPEPASGTGSIGTNLTSISDYSPQKPFVDAFKSSRYWITSDSPNYIFNTNEADKLSLDSNGWVTRLPSASEGVKYTSVGTLMYREVPRGYESGQYVVLYDGQGTLNYGLDATKDTSASTAGRDVINVNATDRGIWLEITATDPSGTGDYIRNIRVVPVASESNYSSQEFNPTFLDKVNNYSTFRFMDWMETNNSKQKEWSDRPTPNQPTYSTKGVSVEVMVDLANQTDSDAWFTMPHQASDDYMRNFATYVKDNLEPGRKVYIEYSNEVWNGGFEQSDWALQQGKNQGIAGGNDIAQKINWFSKRTTEMTQIWDSVFGSDKERVIGVMAAQAANLGVAQKALEYEWASSPQSNEAYGIDALAIAPYFGYYTGDSQYASQLESWTYEADGGLGKLFDEITKGGVLSGGPEGGALQQSYQWMEQHAQLATSEGLQLIAYEGGQHLVGLGDVKNNSRVTQLFIEANRDSRMGDIYRQYFQKWFDLGGGTFAHFADIGTPTKFGSWGALEDVSQSSSPKHDAIMDMIS